MQSRIHRFMTVGSLALAAIALGSCGGATAPRGAQPNFVIILADDLGYGDLGIYGNDELPTPNLDELARTGAVLTDFYVPTPICAPSRASLLTGRYPVRTGVLGALRMTDDIGLPLSERTLAEVLREAGYRTSLIGKWHLGNVRHLLPARQGFDEFFGLPHSNTVQPLRLYRDQQVAVRSIGQADLIDAFTEEAVRFIEANARRPFLLYLAHTAPHVPLEAPDRFRGASGAGPYGDVVMALDWSVGQVIEALDRSGLRDNTLVIFSSDNGPDVERDANGGSPGPLRSGKRTIYEGGIRVPFIASWPGRIPSATRSDAPVASIDLLPTIARLARARLPDDRSVDGVDIWPVLERGEPPEERVLYFFGGGDPRPGALRTGDWKLHIPWPSVTGLPALYDLTEDMGETSNLAPLHPELVESLTSEADRWFTAAIREEIGRWRGSALPSDPPTARAASRTLREPAPR